MPDISDLQDDYRQAGLRVIFLAPNTLPSQERFFTSHTISGIKGVTNLRRQSRQFRMLSSALPSLVLIDRDGVITDAWNGATNYETIEKRINVLISQSLKTRSWLIYYIGAAVVLAILTLVILRRARLSNRFKQHENSEQPT